MKKLDSYQERLKDAQENKSKLETSKSREEGIKDSSDAAKLSGSAKSQLAAAFLNHFFRIYRMGEDADYASAYRARSMVIGKPIEVISPAGCRGALALDIDRDCRLIVRYEDGSIASLSSAEVSIRTEGMR